MTCKQPLTQVLKLTCIKIAVNNAINIAIILGGKCLDMVLSKVKRGHFERRGYSEGSNISETPRCSILKDIFYYFIVDYILQHHARRNRSGQLGHGLTTFKPLTRCHRKFGTPYFLYPPTKSTSGLCTPILYPLKRCGSGFCTPLGIFAPPVFKGYSVALGLRSIARDI